MENLTTLLQQPVSYEGITPQYALQIAQQQANTMKLAAALANLRTENARLELLKMEALNKDKYYQKRNELEEQRLALEKLRNEIESKRLNIEKGRASAQSKEIEARIKQLNKETEAIDRKMKLIDQLNKIKVPVMGHEVSLATLLQVNGGALLLKSAEPDKILERVETFQKLYKKTGKPWLSLSLTFGKLPSNDFGMLQLKNELEGLGGQSGELVDYTRPFDIGLNEGKGKGSGRGGGQTPLLTPEEIKALTNALGGNK